jgi:hypothetical protein
VAAPDHHQVNITSIIRLTRSGQIKGPVDGLCAPAAGGRPKPSVAPSTFLRTQKGHQAASDLTVVFRTSLRFSFARSEPTGLLPAHAATRLDQRTVATFPLRADKRAMGRADGSARDGRH